MICFVLLIRHCSLTTVSWVQSQVTSCENGVDEILLGQVSKFPQLYPANHNSTIAPYPLPQGVR
jgi:hypothetical protein